MTSKPEYRFAFQIIDQTTGDVIEADWCTLIDGERIDQFGICETVDHAVAKMLRNWRNFARADYERENYHNAADAIEEQLRVLGATS